MNSWILPRNYHNWVADYKLVPDGMVRIITMDGKVFTIKIGRAGSLYFFHDGWFNMIQSLTLPKDSLLLFQSEGSLTFRLIYFIKISHLLKVISYIAKPPSYLNRKIIW
ncbi:putative DNA-binding pseudobarrel domain superfamily [Helianthus anomalus]